MNWFKRKQQDAVTPEVFALSLLKITLNIANNASQAFEKHLGASEHSKLSKVQEELLYFSVFSLEYWWTMNSSRTQDERRIVRQAFETHLENVTDMDILQERLNTYAQIVNERKGDNAKFTGFGMKLSELCDMPDVHFLLLAPDLFTGALESLSTLKSVQLKLK